MMGKLNSTLKTRDAPEWKFLAEAEQNETLGRRPNTEHGFSKKIPPWRPILPFFGLWTLAPRAHAALFEYMQSVRVLENITFCSLFTNRLRPFRDFNHHSNQHQPPLPLLIGDMRCSNAISRQFVRYFTRWLISYEFIRPHSYDFVRFV